MINSVPKNITALLPDHISDEYPIFNEFLQAYYNFLNETTGPDNIIKNVLSYNDIDETVDAFRDHIFNELMIQIPNNVMVNRTLLAKHIKELYNKKGTEDSYRLLFRILFDKEITINYPVEQILKSSDGKWLQKTSFICHIPKTIPIDTVRSAIDNIIVVNLGTKNIPIKVSNIVKLDSSNVTYNLYEFFIIKNFFDDFNTAIDFTLNTISTIDIITNGFYYTDDDTISILNTDGGNAHINITTTLGKVTGTTITNGGVGFFHTPILNIISTNGTGAYLSATLEPIFTGIILSSINNVSILQTSNAYLEGKTYDVDYGSGTGATLQIKHKDYLHNVKNISILSFGSYYPDSFNYVINKTPNILQAVPVVTNGVISSINIINGGYGYSIPPTATILGVGKDAHITFSLTAGVVTGYTIVNGGKGYTVAPAIIADDTSIAINASNNKLRVYNGEYINTDGFLSSDMVLYDGNYYQQYSYEIVINELFDIYKGALKKLLHPAGYALWGAYDLQRLIQIQLTSNKIDLERSSSFIDVVYYTMTLAMNMAKKLDDVYSTSNVLEVLKYNMSKPMADSYAASGITEAQSFNVGKALGDTYVAANITDTKVFNIGKVLGDTYAASGITEAQSFNVGKSLSDACTQYMGTNDRYITDGYFTSDYLYDRELSVAFNKVLTDSVTPTESLSIVVN